MASLHDLIYSQQSERNEPSHFATKRPSSPATKRPPLRREGNVDAQDSADTALDRFYKIVPTTSSDVPETIISNGVERRRKRKRGRPPRQRRRRPDGRDEEVLWETAAEAERRVQRTQRRTEYKGVKRRWKERVHNLQEEVDYGNSVEHMARLVMKQRDQSRQFETEEAPAAVENDIVMDSSEEEQQEALGSLWKSMQEETKDDTEEEEEEPDGPWDYWQLGYDTPRKHDLQDFYYYQYSRNNPFQLNHSGREVRLQEIENESVTLPPTVRTSVDEETYFFQRELPTACFAHSMFVHTTNLRTMAARVLSAGKNEKLENRLLRNLYSRPTRKVGREYHVLTQCMERGREFVLFKSHRWKQRSLAARALGVTAEYEHTGSSYRIGFSLQRDREVDRVGLEHVNNVIRLLSDGKIPYQPDTKGCPGNDVKDRVTTTKTENLVDVDITNTENTESRDKGEDLELRCDDVEVEDIEWTSTRTKPKENDAMSANDATETVERLASVQHDPDAACFRTYLASDVDYVHVSGTSPPIPSFPLDETGVIIGGEDRYSRVYHNAKIDDATYIMTVSVLLARLGRARLHKDARAIEQVQGQIMTYTEEVANENVRHLNQMHYKRQKRKELPSALYYLAMMGYCSFVANSGCSLARKNHTETAAPDWLDDDSDVDDKTPLDAKSSVDMNAAALSMYEQCARCPSSTSLTIFPRIHITTALTLIAKNLTASAADILSRPFDQTSHRTPFEIVRKTFEHLEKENMLTDTHLLRSGGNAINVGQLEHTVHEATMIFRKAMEMDPSDLFNHAWYVSGLAASLLLCSGNAIGPKAHVLPSSRKKDEDYDIIFSSPEDVRTQPHEVRQRLPQFEALKRDVANAIQKMMESAHSQKTLRVHLVGMAVLEWKQVIALLVGPRSDDIWSDIRKVHSQHAVQWAIKDRSQSALRMVKELVCHQYVSSEALLEMFAADLENNPGNVFHWRRLVSALGPVGVKVSSRCRKERKRRECAECSCLHRGWNVDHAKVAERQHWWGSGRVSWWDSHVVEMKSSVGATSNKIFRVSSALEKRLVREAPPRDVEGGGTERNAALRAPSVGLAFDEHADLHWLDDQSSLDCDADLGDDQNEDYDSLLPAPFEDTIRATQNPNEASSSLVFDSNEGDPRLEIICYKVILACHLYSVSHHVVRDGVWLLGQGCWKKAECSEWKCLLWLSSMGLYLPQILYDLYVESSRSRLAQYTEQEKEAMRAGLELFKEKNKQRIGIWKDIRDLFPVFKDCSRAHLSSLYQSMKRSGELGSAEEK